MLENNKSFFRRHIGNSEQEQQKMLDQLDYKNIKDLILNTISVTSSLTPSMDENS